MEPDFSVLFHQSSKSLDKGHPSIPRDSRQWPKEWTTVYYKAYPRLPRIELPAMKPEADLFTIIKTRKTRRDFSAASPLNLGALATLLQYSCGLTETSSNGTYMRRAQASGGGRYPVEMYPLVLRGGEGLPAGLYHYNVKQHALELLWDQHLTQDECKEYFVYDWTVNANVVFLMTAVFRRNQAKYGERGYRYILIEAGHIGQNLSLVAEALGLKCVALGGTQDEKIEVLLDIDGVHESVIYALAVGS